MSTKQFYCDCPTLCKERKLVSRTTYFKHAPYRRQLTSQFHNFLESYGNSSGTSIEAAAGSGIEDDRDLRRKRARLQDEDSEEHTGDVELNQEGSEVDVDFNVDDQADDNEPLSRGGNTQMGRESGGNGEPFEYGDPNDDRDPNEAVVSGYIILCIRIMLTVPASTQILVVSTRLMAREIKVPWLTILQWRIQISVKIRTRMKHGPSWMNS